MASMANKVVSAGTLANPFTLFDFLDAATKSLTVDKGLGNLTKLAKLGIQFKDIGLDKIQFSTIPSGYAPDDPNRIRWLPAADDVWERIQNDEPLTRRQSGDAISAGDVRARAPPAASRRRARRPDRRVTRHAVLDAERHRGSRGGGRGRSVRMTTPRDDETRVASASAPGRGLRRRAARVDPRRPGRGVTPRDESRRGRLAARAGAAAPRRLDRQAVGGAGAPPWALSRSRISSSSATSAGAPGSSLGKNFSFALV